MPGQIILLSLFRMGVMIWLWYSFIITASYGGELRAVLLAPTLKSPIETMWDIVKSTYPWKVVDYADGMWEFINATDKRRGMQEFVRDKTPVEYRDFPLEHVEFNFCYS